MTEIEYTRAERVVIGTNPFPSMEVMSGANLLKHEWVSDAVQI